LGLEGSPTRVVRVFAPPRPDRELEWFGGDTPQDAAAALAERLLAERLV